MRIGFDAKRAFHNATGLGNYSRDVLRILSRYHPAHQYFAYTPPARQPRFHPGPGVEIRAPSGLLGRTVPSLWRLHGVVRELERDRIELYHGLSHELPAGIERTGIRTAVTVHDLIFERLPALYGAVDRRIYRAKCRSAVDRADVVIAISEQTRRDLAELYCVPAWKVRVVHQGCDAAFQEEPAPETLRAVAARHELPPRFVLSVGTIERRKNLLLAVRALEVLPDVTLVAVGRPTAYADEVRAFARERGLERRLRLLSGVSTAELAALYRLSSALVYPSRYEGFGIPIVEALFSGTPVVTTRGGCFAEAGGPGSAYVDPDDPDELAAVLSALLADPARASAMREAGRAHAAHFRDEVVAAALVAAYEEAVRS